MSNVNCQVLKIVWNVDNKFIAMVCYFEIEYINDDTHSRPKRYQSILAIMLFEPCGLLEDVDFWKVYSRERLIERP